MASGASPVLSPTRSQVTVPDVAASSSSSFSSVDDDEDAVKLTDAAVRAASSETELQLQVENDILLAQNEQLAARERMLLQDLRMQREAHEQELRAVKLVYEGGSSTRVPDPLDASFDARSSAQHHHGVRVSQAGAGAEQELDELRRQLASAANTNAVLEQSLRVEQQAYHQEVEAVARCSAAVSAALQQLCQQVDSVRVRILPSSDGDLHHDAVRHLTVTDGLLSVVSELDGHDAQDKVLALLVDIGGMLGRLDYSIAYLRLVFEAKLQSASMVKNRLREDAKQAKADLDRILHTQRVADATHQQDKEMLQAQVDQASKRFQELQEKHQVEVKKLLDDLTTRDQAITAASLRVDGLSQAVQDKTRQLHAAEARVQTLEDTNTEHEEARARLSMEMAKQRSELTRLRSQMEELTLVQKFLAARPDGENIAEDRIALIKMVDQLTKQVDELKLRLSEKDSEIMLVKRQHLREKAAATITAQELDMVAADRITDHDLASKILHRKLHPGSGSRLDYLSSDSSSDEREDDVTKR